MGHLRRKFQPGPAGFTEHHGAADPVEQRNPQFPFRALYGLGMRPLGDQQPFRRSGEALVVNHGEEVLVFPMGE